MTSTGASREFLDRVDRWLDGFPDDKTRWTAFCSIQYLFFAGQNEFDEMYRYAAENILKPWLVDVGNIDIFDSQHSKSLDDELGACWLCPVTDSLRINGFLHVTRIKGTGIRPDWKSLSLLGAEDRIRAYVEKKKIKRLVLIEDFVGSGRQIDSVLSFATKVFAGQILVVPLIVCADGDRLLSERAAVVPDGRVTYRPVVVISDQCLVGQDATPGEPELFKLLRVALSAGYRRIKRKTEGGEFGYGLTGSLVVLYSNCPNNTPPVYHSSSKSWSPLFPRSNRE